jgi:hypothetical protein
VIQFALSPDLTLPAEAVTETFLIVGKRESGKSTTGTVFAEELINAGMRTCIIDPTGVWWGLRSSADGTKDGLPVVIFGGEHADLPLPADAGAAMADLVVDQPDLVVILDLSAMRKTAQRRFMTAFLEQLYQRNRDPIHLIIDEADIFAPQRATADIAPLVGAYEDVVRRGRVKGIGSTSITQRPAGMNTDVRSQPETVIAHRLIGKHDIAAMDDWIRVHAEEDDAAELRRTLPRLAAGQAWVWSPQWLKILTRVQMRARRTFDSAATPKVGETRIVPRRLAPVDVDTLRGKLTQVLEQAAAADPAVLRARLKETERQLAAALRGKPDARLAADHQRLQARVAELEARPPAAVIEVPVLDPGQTAAAEQVITGIQDLARQLGGHAAMLSAALSHAAQPPTPAPPGREQDTPGPGLVEYQRARRPGRRRPRPAGIPPAGVNTLPKAQQAILTVLHRFPAGLDKIPTAMLAGYSAGASTFRNALSQMRADRWIDPDSARLMITPEGLAALGTAMNPLPRGPALIDWWMSQVGKAEREILRVLLDAYPDPVAKAEVAARTPTRYSAGASTFRNALSRLRSLQLVTGTGQITVADWLAQAAAPPRRRRVPSQPPS